MHPLEPDWPAIAADLAGALEALMAASRAPLGGPGFGMAEYRWTQATEASRAALAAYDEAWRHRHAAG